MNKERVEKYINVWLNHIRQEDLSELEKDIDMPLGMFITEIIENLYNRYSVSISYVPVNFDNYSDYIISPKNGKYSLEDFLLNRLLRNITWITYHDESHTFMSDSHYDHDFGEVLIDKDRIQTKLTDVRQKRKVVAHEILHGIKTQFYDGNFFDADRYYQMKNELKSIFGTEINDFSMKNNQSNYDYKHCGLTYSSRFIKRNPQKYGSLDLTNLDEILNELEAIYSTKDDHIIIADMLKDGRYFMILTNPESSNTWITNYAFILEKLVDSETLFAGLYIEPEIFYKEFNSYYTQIFQEHYNSDLSGLEIFLEQLKQIKDNPENIDRHSKLLNVLYDCIDRRYVLSGYNEELRHQNITCIGYRGLLELIDGRLLPHGMLNYSDEYNAMHGITKK